MKYLVAIAFSMVMMGWLASCQKADSTTTTPTNTDSFTVAVTGGYGSGKYKVGDTVHVFSAHYTDAQVFNTWAGDASLLNAPNEWHTWFVMPAKNVSLSGSVKAAATYSLTLEQIQGRDRKKPVYYYFPTGHKGFVFLLHGTGGRAIYTATDFEFTQLIKDLVTDNFGVIITEAEEATTGVDANGNGKLQWNETPLDSVANVDYANIKAITDTFYNRGVTNRSKLRYCLGMSNGGYFSSALSYMFRYKAAASYCAQSANVLVQATSVPFQYCMARYDSQPEVGTPGNNAALANSNTLLGRGICSKYFIKEHSPIYTERFARRGDISASQSIAVFNELKAKGYIDGKGYYIGTSDAMVTAYTANPTSFPVLNSLNGFQKAFVVDQIDLSVADHKMYSDYNRATLKFLNTQCQ